MTWRCFAAFLLPFALAACGKARIEGELTREQQWQRLQACNRLWREEGFAQILPASSGGKVDQVAFDELGLVKQRRLAELVACQRSGGAVLPMEIEFYIPGRTLRRMQTTNDIDFVSQL